MHAYNKSFWCFYVVCTHSSIFVVPSTQLYDIDTHTNFSQKLEADGVLLFLIADPPPCRRFDDVSAHGCYSARLRGLDVGIIGVGG